MSDQPAQRPLPTAVRQRLVAHAAQLMAHRPPADLPPSIRRFARFAPAKRVRLGAGEIAAALAAEETFRQAVAELVSQDSPELAEQVRTGHAPDTADPVDVAVLGYLLRPDGWRELLDAISEQLAERQAQAGMDAELDRLRTEIARLEQANRGLVADRDAARGSLKGAVAEQAGRVEDLRRQLSRAQAELRSATRSVADLEAELTALRADRTRAAAADAAQLRKAQARIAGLEADLESGRRTSRLDREHDEARLWVLLETISSAAGGLRRELGIRNPAVRPADSVADGATSEPGARPSTVEASLLDRMLDGPHVHLIVDGYNLTKTGYGTLPLADQRARLVSSLGALAARTGVEVTVAFDGTAAPAGAIAAMTNPRGVRVLFSSPGQLADDLIRELLRAEPAGRTVLVASSDQAVAASVRGAGAWPVTAAVLLDRL